MSEREYIELIRSRAADYIEAISGHLTAEAIEAWETTKRSMSAHTIIDLCDLWMARDDATTKKE